MKKQTSLSRREFIKITSVAGIGLVAAIYLPGCGRKLDPTATSTPTPAPTPTLTPEPPVFLSPNLHVTVGTDGSVTLTCARSELGQGTRTALSMIIAEELEADFSLIRVKQSDADTSIGDQLTGGSTTIQDSYTGMRKAGAVVRAMLIAAAAEKWGIPVENCYAEKSKVIRSDTSESLPYSQLVTTAMSYNPTDFQNVKLKDPKDFKLIGTPMPRVEGPDIVTGKAVYGMDVRSPDMLYAVVARCPTFGGTLASFDDSKARTVPGVVDVFEITSGRIGKIENRTVAVLARDTWSAIQGRDALTLTWDESTQLSLNSTEIEQGLTTRITRPDEEGRFTAYYTVPYFSHSPMETINSTTIAGGSGIEVWAPTQDPQGLKNFLCSKYSIPSANVNLHVPLVGGAFGRRLEFPNEGNLPAFHIQESYEIAKKAGVPVKVVWTREDDMHFEYYHPLSVTRVSANLDNIATLQMTSMSSTGNGIPTGAWRAVTNVPDAFAHESFMDEFAIATKQDTIELHRQILRPQQREVFDLVVDRSGWGSPLEPGHGRGIAIHSSWGVSPCAEAVEVMVDEKGSVKVLKVVSAINCGIIINPDMVKAQIEGGIIFGLTAALKAHISIKNGQVEQSNFHDYPLFTMAEIPEIEVNLVKSDVLPTGTGEMGNPPISAAVANAIYAATGKRIRRLPILPENILSA